MLVYYCNFASSEFITLLPLLNADLVEVIINSEINCFSPNIRAVSLHHNNNMHNILLQYYDTSGKCQHIFPSIISHYSEWFPSVVHTRCEELNVRYQPGFPTINTLTSPAQMQDSMNHCETAVSIAIIAMICP